MIKLPQVTAPKAIELRKTLEDFIAKQTGAPSAQDHNECIEVQQTFNRLTANLPASSVEAAEIRSLYAPFIEAQMKFNLIEKKRFG